MFSNRFDSETLYCNWCNRQCTSNTIQRAFTKLKAHITAHHPDKVEEINKSAYWRYKR